jgi:hypothetical protein
LYYAFLAVPYVVLSQLREYQRTERSSNQKYIYTLAEVARLIIELIFGKIWLEQEELRLPFGFHVQSCCGIYITQWLLKAL